MRRFMPLLCLAPMTALAADAHPQHGTLAPQFEVHEWGTFTAVAGPDGEAMVWKPLAGPSDLPEFVYTLEEEVLAGTRVLAECVSKGCTGRVRMETPVLYFHADEALDVSVQVGFPHGTMTEWYPKVSGTDGRYLNWGLVHVDPALPDVFLTEPADSHYYPARATDAAPVRVCDLEGAEVEKFLFYRGVGDFPISLNVTLDEELTIQGPEGRLLVYENLGGDARWSWVSHDGTSKLERPTSGGDVHDLLEELTPWLVDQGLYEDEARAMVKTWEDSWFEEGLRVLYILPDAEVDALLPVTMSPPPQEFNRVMVGRVEVITPEMVSLARSMTPSERAEHFGRFADPVSQFLR